MDISYQAFNILVILAPGFIASGLLSLTYYQKKREVFDKAIAALVFSLIIYWLSNLISGKFPIAITETKIGDEIIYSPAFNHGSLLLILFLSIALPLLWAYILNNDFLNSLLRRIGITAQTSRHSVWLDVFTEEKRYVVLYLNDGRRIYGWPMRYSSTEKEGFVYLFDPYWITDDNQYIKLDVHGLFLVKKHYIDFIAFTHLDYSTAVKQQNPDENSATNTEQAAGTSEPTT